MTAHTRSENWRRAWLTLFVGIIIGGAVFFANRSENSSTVHAVNERVARVESPCLKYSEDHTFKNKFLCEESFEKAVATINHAEGCVIGRKAGLVKAIRELAETVEVKYRDPCSGVRLRVEESAAAHSRGTDTTTGSGGSAPTLPPTGKHNVSKTPTGTSPGHPTHHPQGTPGGGGAGGGGGIPENPTVTGGGNAGDGESPGATAESEPGGVVGATVETVQGAACPLTNNPLLGPINEHVLGCP